MDRVTVSALVLARSAVAGPFDVAVGAWGGSVLDVDPTHARVAKRITKRLSGTLNQRRRARVSNLFLYLYAWVLCLSAIRQVRIAAYVAGGVLFGLAVFGLALQAIGVSNS